MLYDQAQLVVAYSAAYVATKHPLYADIVRYILTYVDWDLSDKVNFKELCLVMRWAVHAECMRDEKCKKKKKKNMDLALELKTALEELIMHEVMRRKELDMRLFNWI
jgi:hypothetical protein